MIYDLVYSKIISLKFSAFISFLFLIILLFLNYHLNSFQFIFNIFFLIGLICFFVFREYQKIFFIFLNIINLYLIFEILLINKEIFFLIVFLAFINDTLAFISGKNFKGPLIIPHISPKKTWSGTLFSFFISFFLLIYFEFNLFFSFFISISFFLGDIFFSYFKRLYGIKDFSNLLRGHGGFLDRFDSIFFSIFLLSIYFSYLI